MNLGNPNLGSQENKAQDAMGEDEMPQARMRCSDAQWGKVSPSSGVSAWRGERNHDGWTAAEQTPTPASKCKDSSVVGSAVPLQTVTTAPLTVLCKAMAGIGVGWCLLQTSVSLRRKGLAVIKMLQRHLCVLEILLLMCTHLYKAVAECFFMCAGKGWTCTF